MNRRDFVRQGAGVVGSAWMGNRFANAATQTAAISKLKIPYVRDTIPEFSIPAYRGEWYEDTIPDTLDLAERLRLAVHGATSITDPEADSEIYWIVDFHRNPPVMIHDFNDWVLQCEGILECVPLARIASGSTENDNVDLTWMANWVLKSIGPDGLLYVPMGGRSWGRANALMPGQRAFRPDGSSVAVGDPSVNQVAGPVTCARVLSAITVYYLRDHNPMWKAAAEKMIQRLSRLAIHRDDYAYFPNGLLEPDGSYGSQIQMPIGTESIEWGGGGRLIQGLAQYYNVTGYEPAIVLARKLTNYLCYHAKFYTPDGAWLISDMEKSWLPSFKLAELRLGGHSTHAIGGYAMLEYGLVSGDRPAVDLARGILDFAIANSAPLIGFFPEFLVPGYHTCETCMVADMLTLGVKLSASGVADYWDGLDRWVRNQFVEQQLTSTEWVHEMSERQPRKPVLANETADRVAERNIGAFAGWASPNDFSPDRYLGYEATFMHCCLGNGTQAMYYVWEHILDFKDEELRINLLMNRASTVADIYSHIPYEGRVELKVKSPCRSILIRVPEWIESGSARVNMTRNSQPIAATWYGRYLQVGTAQAGDRFTMRFPIETRTAKQTIAGVEYTLEIRGNTVISISPGGKNGPLYRREFMRADAAPQIKIRRFVSDQPIAW